MPQLTTPDGAVLDYTDQGSGRVIVLLHGVCMSREYFRENVGPLAAAQRVIALDFRGHGASPDCTHGHTVAQYARDVEFLLESLDLHDVVLAGWSMGSIVIWQYVEQFGTDRLAAQIVISQGPSDLKRDDWPLGVLTIDELGGFCTHLQEAPREAWEEFVPAMFCDERADLDAWINVTMRVTPTTQTAILLSQTLPDGRTALDGLKLPTLLAWGADEKLIAVANGEWIRDHVPGSELVMFAKSGHCPMLEESSQFNEVVTRFVGSLVAPKGPASGEA